jgi:energy-converting hydrogenase Eha subunit C
MTEKVIEKGGSGDIKHRRAHKLIGIVIAVIGFFWLAKKVGWIPVAASGSSVFWPVVTIALAVLIIFSSKYRRKRN